MRNKIKIVVQVLIEKRALNSKKITGKRAFCQMCRKES
jgi:hypothetical protein